MSFEIVDLQQRTAKWYSFRRNHIGSSDASVIMDVNPWKNIYQLWLEKTNIEVPSSYVSTAMQRGTDLEPLALDAFNYYMGYRFKPAVVKSTKYDFMAASLDGMCEIGDFFDPSELTCQIVEIKVPNLETHMKAISGKVPEIYYPQIQHQLAVTGLPFAYYFSFDGEDGIYLKVDRDEAYISDLIEKEREFWACVQELREPECKNKNYKYIEDEQCLSLSAELKQVTGQIRELEKREKALKDALTSKLLENSIVGPLKLSLITRIGNVQYEKIEELKGVDLEPYRKPSSQYWKVEEV